MAIKEQGDKVYKESDNVEVVVVVLEGDERAMAKALPGNCGRHMALSSDSIFKTLYQFWQTELTF